MNCPQPREAGGSPMCESPARCWFQSQRHGRRSRSPRQGNHCEVLRSASPQGVEDPHRESWSRRTESGPARFPRKPEETGTGGCACPDQPIEAIDQGRDHQSLNRLIPKTQTTISSEMDHDQTVTRRPLLLPLGEQKHGRRPKSEAKRDHRVAVSATLGKRRSRSNC